MVFSVDGFYTRSMPSVKWDEESKAYVTEDHDGAATEGNWIFLFVDLVFVALISKLSMVLENCALSVHTYVFCCTVFTVMYVTRLQLDDYSNRFYCNDVFHRILYFGYTLAMFIMALNVNSIDTGGLHNDAICSANLYDFGFASGFIISRCTILVLYVVLMYEDPVKARKQFLGQIIRTALSAFIVFVLVMVEIAAEQKKTKGPFPPTYRIYIYVVALFIEIGYTCLHHIVLGMRKMGYELWENLISVEYYPMDVLAHQSRQGSFIMMVLGEAVIALLLPYYDTSSALSTYYFNIFACLLIFLFGLQYFDATVRTESDEHAMSHSLLSAFLYTWLHLVLGLCVFMTSASLGIMYKSGIVLETNIATAHVADDDSLHTAWDHKNLVTGKTMLSCSVASVMILLLIIRSLHTGLENIFKPEQRSRLRNKVAKLVYSCLHFTVSSWGLPTVASNVVVHAVLLLIQTASEIQWNVALNDKNKSTKMDAHSGAASSLSSSTSTHADPAHHHTNKAHIAAACMVDSDHAQDIRASIAAKASSPSFASNVEGSNEEVVDDHRPSSISVELGVNPMHEKK